MIRFLQLMSVSLLLVSCRQPVLVEEQWIWAESRWTSGDVKSMSIDVADTSKTYAMDLILKWNDHYAYENLYVRIKTVFPSGKENSSVTSMEMMDEDGTWAGDCGNRYCRLRYPLQVAFRFPELGTYTWSIEPYMRIDTVEGIESLSVICRPLKP